MRESNRPAIWKRGLDSDLGCSNFLLHNFLSAFNYVLIYNLLITVVTVRPTYIGCKPELKLLGGNIDILQRILCALS